MELFRAHFYTYIHSLAGKMNVGALRELVSYHFEEFLAVVELTPAALTSLLASCAAQVLGFHCWPEDKSLAMLGASSFDVVRLLGAVEDRLGMGETVLSNLFETLLTEPLHSVVSNALKLLLRTSGEEEVSEDGLTLSHGREAGKKRSADTAGVPEDLPHSKHRGGESHPSVGQVDVKCWRRGEILHNGRSVGIS